MPTIAVVICVNFAAIFFPNLRILTIGFILSTYAVFMAAIVGGSVARHVWDNSRPNATTNSVIYRFFRSLGAGVFFVYVFHIVVLISARIFTSLLVLFSGWGNASGAQALILETTMVQSLVPNWGTFLLICTSALIVGIVLTPRAIAEL